MIYIMIVIMSVVTIALRFLPFVVFKAGKSPKWLDEAGKLLPYATMAMLVVYCLKDVDVFDINSVLPTTIATIITIFSYVFKRNSLLSIIVGTIVYMFLIQVVFV